MGAAWGLAGCVTTETQWQTAGAGPYYRAEDVDFITMERHGTILIDPAAHFLYFVQGAGKARRYGIGVGGEGFGWSGIAIVHSKQEWPDWYPTKEIIQRQPQLTARLTTLQGGHGIRGGENNPLGARALYLWQDNKDTLYRIHGTNEPWTIGQNVSSGCIRLINDDVIDLYNRTPLGTKVVVLPSNIGRV
jgi:lipoprotein-anchoring transpeptidase ErfK/SrfK